MHKVIPICLNLFRACLVQLSLLLLLLVGILHVH